MGPIYAEFHRCARLSQSREIDYPHRKKALESRGSRGEATMKIEYGEEPVGLRGAVARATPVEQIAEIVPRA